MDWARLERQIEAIGDALGDGARHASAEAERAQRSLARLDALERLIAATPAPAPMSAPAPPEPEQPESEPPEPEPEPAGAEPRLARPARPQRASLHRSPLADLFRDTAAHND